MRIKHILCLGFLALTPFILAAPAHANETAAKPVVFAKLFDAGSWFPYQIPNNPENPGILIELIPLIFERAEVPVAITPLPAKRSVIAFEEGEVDFEWSSPAWFPNQTLPSDDIGTIAVMHAEEMIVTRADQPVAWQTTESLKGYEVGTINGYTYATDKDFQRYDVANEETLIRMLAAGRLDVAIIDKLSAQYWAQQHSIDITLHAAYSSGPLIMRAKRHPNAPHIPPLNEAITSLKADGSIKRIIDRYTTKTFAATAQP